MNNKIIQRRSCTSKRHGMPQFAAIAILCIAPASALAADVTSTWLGGANSWTSSNWSNVPSVPHFPNNGNGGFTYDAVVNSGTVTLDQDIEIEKLTFGGGTITGDSNLTLHNLSSAWSAGSMSGTGTTTIGSGGSLTINGSTAHQLNRSLINEGAVTWTSANVSLTNAAFQNNDSFISNSANTRTFSGGGGTSSFNNVGTFTKLNIGATEFTVATSAATFNNSGSVDIQAGTLRLGAGGSHTGDFSVASGAFLELIGTHIFSDPAEIDGAGTFEIETGATVDGTLSISGVTTSLNNGSIVGSGILTIQSGLLAWSAGTMSGTGQTVIESAGLLTINGGVTHQLNRTLVNDGAATWASANVSMDNGTFQNNGSFTSNSTGTRTFFSVGGTNSFHNAGTFTKLNTGTTEFDVAGTGITFNNTGIVDIQAGTLRLESEVTQHVGSQFTGGTWRIGAGATLNITTGSNITTNLADVTLDGTGSTFAKISTLVDNQGSFSVLNSRSFIATAAFSNSGTLTVGAGSTFTAPSMSQLSGGELTGGTWYIGGTLVVSAGSNIDVSYGNVTLDGPGATFAQIDSLLDNRGHFSILNGRDFIQSSADFSNSGTLTVGAGSTFLVESVDQISGIELTGGTWHIGGALVANGTPIIVNHGEVTLDGPASAFSEIDSLVDNRGSFAILNDRNFTAGGTFDNHGTLTIGAGSTFTAPSGFTQHATGTLRGTGTLAGTFNNAGPACPRQLARLHRHHGRLRTKRHGCFGNRSRRRHARHVARSSSSHRRSPARGRLELPLVEVPGQPTYSPQINDEIVFLTAQTGVTGTFDSTFFSNLPASVAQELEYNTNDVRLKFVAPEPIQFISADPVATWSNNATWEANGSGTTPVSKSVIVVENLAGVTQRVEVTTSNESAHQLFVGDADTNIAVRVLGVNLSVAAGTVIEDHGAIELTDSAALITQTVEVQDGGLLAGNGTIKTNDLVVSGGTLRPGFSVGHLDVEGNYEQQSDGTLLVDVEGTQAGEWDTVDITGTVQLGGTLRIDASNYGTSNPGAEFEIISAGSLAGTFESVESVGNNNIYFKDSYDYDAGTVNVYQLNRGDMNGNESIDDTDYDLFVFGLMNASLSGYFAECNCDILPQQGGDFSGNGRLDFDDIPGFQNQLAGLGMSDRGLLAALERYYSNVPEPSAAMLATICGYMIILVGGQRRRYNEAPFCELLSATEVVGLRS